MAEQRFLVVRLSSLGDIVHALPAVSALRQSYPSSKILWITHPRWRSLVESAGLANEIRTIDTKKWSSIREEVNRIRATRYTTAIDYQGLWKSATIPFLAGIPRRIGFSSQSVREFGVPILYTQRVHSKSVHVVDQNGDLSLQAGCQNGVAPISLRVDPKDEETVRGKLSAAGISQYIVLSPGGGWRSKCWPVERFAELAVRIAKELGIRVVLNYGPGEEDLISAMQSHGGEANAVPYNGTLGQLMALLKNARMVVAGDTGPLHLADALDTRVVAIFGPTDPARNGPYHKNGIILRDAHVETTYKRHDVSHPSLMKISVDQVFDAVRQVNSAR